MSDISAMHTPNNSSDIPPAAPAATVILLRPTAERFEVLLLLRAKAVKFAGGSWVFPGGRIDNEDYQGNLDNERQAAKVAAARESQEEAGLTLNAQNFEFFSHWTTPIAEKKRFSTWFLWGQLAEAQEITVDDSEIVDYLWTTPENAIAMMQDKKLKIMPPTYLTLLELSHCASIEDVQELTDNRELPTYFPNMVLQSKTPGILLGGDDGYKTGEMEHDGKRERVVMGAKGWEYIKD